MFGGIEQQTLLTMISHLIFIVITWYALQGFQIEKLMKPNHVFQAKLMLILLTITISSTVSNFFWIIYFGHSAFPHFSMIGKL